jgi:hypothetical protein
MADLQLLPDAEALISSFLRDQAEVISIVGDRVFSALPADPGPDPMVRVTRYGGSPRFSIPLWIDHPQVQIDAFGGPKATAHDLMVTAMAVLSGRLVGSHDEGVVTAIVFGQMRWLPDEAFTKPRPRYLVTATLTTHPTPNGVDSI